MKAINWFLSLLMVLLLFSCTKREAANNEVGTVEGYRPVYMEPSQATTTSVKSSEPLEKPGKIYWYYNLMLLTDKHKGVHVIDISDPQNPVRESFIEIPGVRDVAVKAGFLYADNITDLVVFNITDIHNITQVHRVEGVYPLEEQMYPAGRSGYFECVDTSKGYVVGWEKATLEDPKCRR